MLFEIFTEYRNGNVEAINKLYTDMVIASDNVNNKEKIKINDAALMFNINSTFRDFEKHFKTRKKKCAAPFVGDIEDMKQIFIMELYSLFDDEDFQPDDESAIFKRLNYNVIARLNTDLKNQPVTKELIFTDEDYEEYEIVPKELIFDPFEEIPKSGYSGEIKGFLNVIRSVDLETMCRKNAETQIRVANVIKKFYRVQDGKFPTTDKMLYYYKKEYGCEISKTEYSRALNGLFNLICENTLMFRGMDISRRDYISKYDNNSNLREPMKPLIQFCCFNADETMWLIDLVNQLEGYVPETAAGDKFNRIIKSDIIREICYKNKAIIRWIDCAETLSVEDYRDLLEGICIMVSEYIGRQIDYQMKLFLLRYENYKFDSSFNDMYSIAMGKSRNRSFWTLLRKNDGLHIVKFIESGDNRFTAVKGKADIKVDCEKIYQIGKCIFILSENDKVIYCRSAYGELINVRRDKNKYSANVLTA